MVSLEIYVTDKCATCSRVLATARLMLKKNPNISLKVKDINESSKRLSIVPAVFLNEELFCYGDFNPSTILERIKDNSV